MSTIDEYSKNTPDTTRPQTGTQINATRPTSRFGRPAPSGHCEEAETREKIFDLIDNLHAVAREPKIVRDENVPLAALVELLEKKISQLLDVADLSRVTLIEIRELRRSEHFTQVPKAIDDASTIARLERIVEVQRQALTRNFNREAREQCAGLCGSCCLRETKVNARAVEFNESWEPEGEQIKNKYDAFFRSLMTKHD
jgi:hypothetical protein